MTHRLSLLLSLLALAFAVPCVADVTGNGAGDDIPDDVDLTGVSTITITENEIIERAHFCIEDLTHHWVGDLTATITHTDFDGNLIGNATLFRRTGRANSNGPGDSTDVNGTYIFRDDANSLSTNPNGGDWWTEAGNNNGAIAQGVYRASDAFGGFLSLDSLFAGQSTEGNWTLRISDDNEDNSPDPQSFGGWSLELITAVPEPTTGVMLLGTGLMLFRRRRS